MDYKMEVKLMQLVTFLMNTVLLASSVMGSMKLDCSSDLDCAPYQFCYVKSSNCVNYTRCDQYNREEGPELAKFADNCGPCLPGYTAEVLITGSLDKYCKKIDQDEDTLETPVEGIQETIPIILDEEGDSPAPNPLWIYIPVGVVLGLLLLAIFYYCFKKLFLNTNGEKWFKKMGGFSFVPSAPPPESGVYHVQTRYINETDEEPPIYSSVINSNVNQTDKNKLVNAVPFNAPSWVRVPPYPSDDHDDLDNLATSITVSTSTPQVDDEATTPSVWSPDEQISIQIPTRAFAQFSPENGTNDQIPMAAVPSVSEECPSTAESSEDSSSTSSPPRSSTGARSSGDHYRGPNVQINQMITLNMINNDN